MKPQHKDSLSFLPLISYFWSMNAPIPSKLYSIEEYLEFETKSEWRHEYEDGLIVSTLPWYITTKNSIEPHPPTQIFSDISN